MTQPTICVEGTDLFKAGTLLGRRGFPVGVLDLAQDAVTLAFDQGWTSEKEPDVAWKTVFVRNLFGAEDEIGAGNGFPGDKAGAIELAVAGSVGWRGAWRNRWRGGRRRTRLGQQGSGQQGDCNHQIFHSVLSISAAERRLPKK